ncbi:uncharacterized protein LOC109603182 [Aethina tumida]|uniref:uncharacterized protein LOC109603182 n=1 Tax=Aethina tumida TaxID=116153 RepID=UPI00096B66BF|nr:uncharacterized protein LOC109603182 [Aethina tumida]
MNCVKRFPSGTSLMARPIETIFALLLCTSRIVFQNVRASDNGTETAKDIVHVKSHINIKYFEVPTSDDPVLTWVEVQRGTFPYTSIMESSDVSIGEPLTIYVYLRDKSNMYDARVTQCWASDAPNALKAKNKFLLTGLKYRRSKIIGEWQKYTLPKDMEIKSFLYTSFKAFKFPETQQIYISCDVELCFRSCITGYKLSNLL